MADKAGLEANIQPRNTMAVGSPSRTSAISRKAELSGGSSGGRLSQVRAMISNVPNRTTRPTGAATVETLAVALSSACSTATSSFSACAAVLVHKTAINSGLTDRSRARNLKRT